MWHLACKAPFKGQRNPNQPKLVAGCCHKVFSFNHSVSIRVVCIIETLTVLFETLPMIVVRHNLVHFIEEKNMKNLPRNINHKLQSVFHESQAMNSRESIYVKYEQQLLDLKTFLSKQFNSFTPYRWLSLCLRSHYSGLCPLPHQECVFLKLNDVRCWIKLINYSKSLSHFLVWVSTKHWAHDWVAVLRSQPNYARKLIIKSERRKKRQK